MEARVRADIYAVKERQEILLPGEEVHNDNQPKALSMKSSVKNKQQLSKTRFVCITCEEKKLPKAQWFFSTFEEVLAHKTKPNNDSHRIRLRLVRREVR